MAVWTLLRRWRLTLPLALALLVGDCTTKELAESRLAPEQVPHEVVGDVVRFTLGYNDGAAMNLPVGPNARGTLIAISLLALVVLLYLSWRTPDHALRRRIALGLLIGGTLGNLVSRIATPRGVVDFIDIGLGAHRFYIFNVADIGITLGAFLLAWSIARAEDEPRPATSSR